MDNENELPKEIEELFQQISYEEREMVLKFIKHLIETQKDK